MVHIRNTYIYIKVNEFLFGFLEIKLESNLISNHAFIRISAFIKELQILQASLGSGEARQSLVGLLFL